MISAISCVHDLERTVKNEINAIKTKSAEKIEKIKDKTEKEVACREVALKCIKKHFETGELNISLNGIASIRDIRIARANKEMFNEQLSRFGLKIDAKRQYSEDYGPCIALSKLKD